MLPFSGANVQVIDLIIHEQVLISGLIDELKVPTAIRNIDLNDDVL